MSSKLLVVGALVAATWGGVHQVLEWIDGAHGAAVASDLGSSAKAISLYVQEHGVPAGRFVAAGQRQLDDGATPTISGGDSISATGTWSGAYCVVARATSGQVRYFDSVRGFTGSIIEPGGACAAVDASGM